MLIGTGRASTPVRMWWRQQCEPDPAAAVLAGAQSGGDLWHYLRGITVDRLYRDYDALQEEAVRSLCAVREDTVTIKTSVSSISQGLKFPESESDSSTTAAHVILIEKTK